MAEEMINVYIGNIIKEIREMRMVSKLELCQGLCHEATLTRIEEGEEEPGKLLADTFLERLGVSPNKFGCQLTWEEEAAYRHRAKLLSYLKQEMKDWKEYSEEEEEPETKSDSESGAADWKCQKQFAQYVCLVKEIYSKEENTFCLKQLEQQVLEAIRLTAPDWREEELRNFRLSRVEWGLVVLLADLYTRQETSRERGVFLYREILEQMEKQMGDEELIRECYPYVVAVMIRRFSMQQDYSREWICQIGIEKLQQWKRLYGLEELLHYHLHCAEQEANKKLSEEAAIAEGLQANEWMEERQKQELGWQRVAWEALRETRKKYHGHQDSVFYYLAKLVEGTFHGSGQGEQIRRLRISKGMTQRELYDGICSKDTLSRIERGKQKPQGEIFRSLSKRLGQRGIRYIPFVFSCQYKQHDSYKKISSLIAQREYEEARFELRRLKRGLEQEGVEKEPENQQLLIRLEVIIESGRGKISPEEGLKKLETALALTIPLKEKIEGWPLNQSEIVLLNNIANTKERLKDLSGAIALLEAVRKSCESHRNGIEWDKEGYMMTLYNLSRYLGNSGKYQEEDELIETGIKLAFETAKEQFFGMFLYKKAWNLEEQERLAGDRDKKMGVGKYTKENTCSALELHRQAFSLAYLFDKKSDMIRICNRCQKKYEIQIEFWYE